MNNILKFILVFAVVFFGACNFFPEQDIVTGTDDEYCGNVVSTVEKSDCLTLAEKEDAKIERLKSYGQQHDRMMDVVYNGRVEDCETLDIEIYKKFCLNNSYIFQAQLSSNPLLCDKIDSKELVLACKSGVNPRR